MDINNVTTSEKNIYLINWNSESQKKNFSPLGKIFLTGFFLLELHKHGLTRSTKNHHFLTELEFGIPSKI